MHNRLLSCGISRIGKTFAAISLSLLMPNPAAWAFDAAISVGAAPGLPVNRLLLGNNIQWVDNGDGMVDGNGALNRQAVALLQPTGATILRFPGGSLTDSYHWKDAVGHLGARQSGRNLANQMKASGFGTDEFLQLVKAVNAIPIFSVNVPSGTPEEAVAWINYVKQAAAEKGLPAVRYWEIGNEPYLKEEKRGDLQLQPAEFISRFNKFAQAMRAADPNIKIGLPLRTDRINNVPVSAFPNFNQTLLSGLSVPVDYLALHYYLPFVNNGAYSPADVYWACMAAADVMAKDITDTIALVKAQTNATVPVAITEYNSMFTLGKGDTDAYISSLAGAMMVADMLRVFNQMPSVEFANLWSAVGNWYFGMVGQDGKPRPVYYVMQLYSELLHGNYLPVNITAPVFSTPSVGLVPAAGGQPLLTAVATGEAGHTRLLVINKSLTEAANIKVELGGGDAMNGKAVDVRGLTGPSPLAGAPGQSPVEIKQVKLPLTGNSFTVPLPPHTVALFEVQ